MNDSQTIDTNLDALRKLWRAASVSNTPGQIDDGARLAFNSALADAFPAILDELDRLRAEIARLTDAGAEEPTKQTCPCCRVADGERHKETCDTFYEVDGYSGRERKEGLLEYVFRAPPPPAAADRGVPGQRVEDAAFAVYVGWFESGEPEPESEMIREVIRAALAMAPKAEDVRRETLEEAAHEAENWTDRHPDWRFTSLAQGIRALADRPAQ